MGTLRAVERHATVMAGAWLNMSRRVIQGADESAHLLSGMLLRRAGDEGPQLGSDVQEAHVGALQAQQRNRHGRLTRHQHRDVYLQARQDPLS